MANEITIPKIGTRGASGVRNGRASWGLRRRMSHTPAQTMTKASNVPMLTISVSTSMGRDAASTATKMPTVRVKGRRPRSRDRWGERYRNRATGMTRQARAAVIALRVIEPGRTSLRASISTAVLLPSQQDVAILAGRRGMRRAGTLRAGVNAASTSAHGGGKALSRIARPA